MIRSESEVLDHIHNCFDPVECMKNHIYPLPAYMEDGVTLYVIEGIEPESFLTAVLANDLKAACTQADTNNRERLWEWGGFLYNCVPRECQGSYERVNSWIALGGLRGINKPGGNR